MALWSDLCFEYNTDVLAHKRTLLSNVVSTLQQTQTSDAAGLEDFRKSLLKEGRAVPTHELAVAMEYAAIIDGAFFLCVPVHASTV
jgi:hypothetical protein